MRSRVLLALAAVLALPAAGPAVTGTGRPQTEESTLASGARWAAIVPASWNGVLLLHSRGYAAEAGTPDPAPARYREALLSAGYALAASNYGAGGWSVAEAVPAQEEAVAAFARRYGKPRRVIGYGFSMGGLVTTALAEREHPVLDGAIALCSSMGGSLAMMNMGLDGAFAFRTLVAPQAGIELTGIADDRANAARVAAAARKAAQTPQGRARLVLVATLAGIPAWVPPQAGEPDEKAFDRQIAALVSTFPMGVFLPRAEQEHRAGGTFSWNTAVDYRRQLETSGQAEFVGRAYRQAGLNLDADLSALAQAPRVAAAPAAVDYMARYYIPTGRPKVPLLALQALGDTVTSPSLQQGYAAVAPAAMMQSLYVAQAGHCDFSSEQVLEAIFRVGRRLDSGRWPAPAATHVLKGPAPLLRPCFQGNRCPGRPLGSW